MRDRHGRSFTRIVSQHLEGALATGAAGGLQPMDVYTCTTFCYLLTYPIYEGNVLVGLISTLACTLICSSSGSGSGSGGTSTTGGQSN